MAFFDKFFDILGEATAAAAPALISAALAKTNMGDLKGMVDKLQQGGLGAQVQSWLGNGSNMPVTADQLRAALGDEHVDKLAEQFGRTGRQGAVIALGASAAGGRSGEPRRHAPKLIGTTRPHAQGRSNSSGALIPAGPGMLTNERQAGVGLIRTSSQNWKDRREVVFFCAVHEFGNGPSRQFAVLQLFGSYWSIADKGPTTRDGR